MGFDPLYWLIFGVGMLLSLGAAGYVKLKFSRGQEVPLSSGMTGADVARAVLHHFDIHGVTVQEHQGFLSDHYNPTDKTLNLSAEVFNGRSAAAAGVAAHEVGHAVQHAHGDVTMWGRTVLVYPAHFGSMLAPYMVIGGLLFSQGQHLVPGTWQHGLAVAGVALFGVALLCSLVIVFNEFNASARAKVALATLGIVRHGEEEDTVDGVLNAAGLTYVAAAVVALMNMAYWVYVAFGRRD